MYLKGLSTNLIRWSALKVVVVAVLFKSGAFILSSEVNQLPEDIKVRLKVQSIEKVKTIGGVIKVYMLGTGSMGMCMFFNPTTAKCGLEKKS